MVKTQAEVQADLLHDLYGVRVEILKTNDEYHAKATLLRTFKEKVYFISEESPTETHMATEVLIRHYKLRTELMHASRSERASENKKDLANIIENIRMGYILKHNGAEPSANKIASILNDQNVASPSGKAKWYSETVKRVLGRTDSTKKRKTSILSVTRN